MKNWYDDLTPEQEEQLKTNDAPLGLSVVGDLLKTVPNDDLEVYAMWGVESKWRDVCGEICQTRTYRLNPSWQRPAKKPGMVSYEFKLSKSSIYQFQRLGIDSDWVRWCPDDAKGMKGYLGIEFAEFPGRIFGSWPSAFKEGDEIGCTAWLDVDDRKNRSVALTPVKVWFKGEA